MLKEEHEVVVLGMPQTLVLMMSTVINITVPNHIIWTLFNTLFMNPCCLGFEAFTYSVKSRDQNMVGGVTGTQNYVTTTKLSNIWAPVLGLFLTIIFIILTATLAH